MSFSQSVDKAQAAINGGCQLMAAAAPSRSEAVGAVLRVLSGPLSLYAGYLSKAWVDRTANHPQRAVSDSGFLFALLLIGRAMSFKSEGEDSVSTCIDISPETVGLARDDFKKLSPHVDLETVIDPKLLRMHDGADAEATARAMLEKLLQRSIPGEPPHKTNL